MAYEPTPTLFGDVDEKASNEKIAEGFRQRLLTVAGFKHVPKPIAMRNSQNVIVYYLFFASNNPVAPKIVEAIFKKYSERRGA